MPEFPQLPSIGVSSRYRPQLLYEVPPTPSKKYGLVVVEPVVKLMARDDGVNAMNWNPRLRNRIRKARLEIGDFLVWIVFFKKVCMLLLGCRWQRLLKSLSMRAQDRMPENNRVSFTGSMIVR